MSIFLRWDNKQNSVVNKKQYLFKTKYASFFASKGLCWSCPIFDHAKQKCTHPKLGCDSNSARIQPWLKEVLCPKKFKPS